MLKPSTSSSAAQVLGVVAPQLVRLIVTEFVNWPVLEKLFDRNTSGVPPPKMPVPPRTISRSVGFQLKPTRGWIRYFSSNVAVFLNPYRFSKSGFNGGLSSLSK